MLDYQIWTRAKVSPSPYLLDVNVKFEWNGGVVGVHERDNGLCERGIQIADVLVVDERH